MRALLEVLRGGPDRHCASLLLSLDIAGTWEASGEKIGGHLLSLMPR